MEKHRAPRLHSPCDAVIYEVHIRDFSIHEDSGMRHKGKYVAFTEDGTETSGADVNLIYNRIARTVKSWSAVFFHLDFLWI